MSITTTSVLPAPVQNTLSNRLLAVPVPYMIHSIPAERYTQPRGGGRFMTFRRYNPLTVDTVPLGNTGVTPPAQQLTAVDINAEMQFYGKRAVQVYN